MSALRALRQVSSSSSRVLLARNAGPLSRNQLAAFAVRAAPTMMKRTLSVSARVHGEGSTDVILSQKLQEELSYETESAKLKEEPEFLTEFKSQGVWKIEDKACHDEVVLSRTFGNEKIRLLFSIADLQTDTDEDFEDESPEAETENDENSDEEEVLHTFPIRASLTITKTTGPGSLSVDMVCQEGNFVIENVSFYGDSKVGTELTADADWARRGLYMGPQFDSLDVGVQEQFESYLQERGVNEHVALFIPEYAEYKEQGEYVTWLKSVKKFIDQ